MTEEQLQKALKAARQVHRSTLMHLLEDKSTPDFARESMEKELAALNADIEAGAVDPDFARRASELIERDKDLLDRLED